MSDCVTYEFFTCDNPVDRRDEGRWIALAGVCAADFAAAHRMFGANLRRVMKEAPCLRYVGRHGEVVLASASAQGSICAVFPLGHISVGSALAIVDVCAFLGCKLVPLDGGPEVAASTQALVADLTRRAVAWLRP